MATSGFSNFTSLNKYRKTPKAIVFKINSTRKINNPELSNKKIK